VQCAKTRINRFNGFYSDGKPLKRLVCTFANYTRLKPGVNDIGQQSRTVVVSLMERSLSGENGEPP
jgi:hypothetical protein